MGQITQEMIEAADERNERKIMDGSDEPGGVAVADLHHELNVDDNGVYEVAQANAVSYMEFMALQGTKITPEELLAGFGTLWADGFAVGVIAARMEMADGTSE